MPSRLRLALAGSSAALVWAAQEPLDRHIFGCDYSDVAVLGKAMTRGRYWRTAGLAVHALNGALFGLAYHEARRRLPIERHKLAGVNHSADRRRVAVNEEAGDSYRGRVIQRSVTGRSTPVAFCVRIDRGVSSTRWAEGWATEDHRMAARRRPCRVSSCAPFLPSPLTGGDTRAARRFGWVPPPG